LAPFDFALPPDELAGVPAPRMAELFSIVVGYTVAALSLSADEVPAGGAALLTEGAVVAGALRAAAALALGEFVVLFLRHSLRAPPKSPIHGPRDVEAGGGGVAIVFPGVLPDVWAPAKLAGAKAAMRSRPRR